MTEQVVKNSPLVAALLEPVESRLVGVTEGPWEVDYCGMDCCITVSAAADRDEDGHSGASVLFGDAGHSNANFIAHSRALIPALADLARQQTEKLEEIRRVVEMDETEEAAKVILLRAILNKDSGE